MRIGSPENGWRSEKAPRNLWPSRAVLEDPKANRPLKIRKQATSQGQEQSITSELLELEAARSRRESLVIAIVDDNDGPPEQFEQEESEVTQGLVQVLDITRSYDRAHPAGELYRESTRRALRARTGREENHRPGERSGWNLRSGRTRGVQPRPTGVSRPGI
eukprot:9711128-Heterocapsa_arctica.AAC.1